MASDINKFHFRLVLLGANRTGKTAILNRFLSKKFDEKYKPTVEDLFSKEFDLGSIELKVSKPRSSWSSRLGCKQPGQPIRLKLLGMHSADAPARPAKCRLEWTRQVPAGSRMSG